MKIPNNAVKQRTIERRRNTRQDCRTSQLLISARHVHPCNESHMIHSGDQHVKSNVFGARVFRDIYTGQLVASALL